MFKTIWQIFDIIWARLFRLTGLESQNMKPKIIEKDQIILIGFNFFGDPFTSPGWTEENEIGRLWNRFENYLTRYGDRLKTLKNKEVGYEVWSVDEETMAKGKFDIFAGMEVEELEDVPVEVLVKILPPTKYAVFTFEGQQINSDWPRMIYQEWLPNSEYQEAYKYNFQRYDQRFKGIDNLDESVMEVHVPIKKR
jgi:AraC family transcriptional regulator